MLTGVYGGRSAPANALLGNGETNAMFAQGPANLKWCFASITECTSTPRSLSLVLLVTVLMSPRSGVVTAAFEKSKWRALNRGENK